MKHTNETILRVGAIALLLGAAASTAAAQSLWVGTPGGLILQGDAKTGGFGGSAVCGGPVASMTFGAGTVYAASENGGVYRMTAGTTNLTFAYTVASDAQALAFDNGTLLVGGTNGNVLRVVAATGALQATLPGLFGASVDAMALQGSSLAIGSTTSIFGEGNASTGNFQVLGACGGSIHAMARIGDEMFLGDANGNVYRFRFSTHNLIYAYTVATSVEAMVADGSHLLIAGSSGDVLRVNPVTGLVLATFPIGQPISALAIGDPLPDPGTGFCFGTACPCGNTDAAGGCANTTLHGAFLRGSGSVGIGADDLVLRTEFLPPNVLSRLYMSQAQSAVPFGDGLLCASSGGYPAFRFPAVSSGPGGVLVEGPGIAAYAAANFGPIGTLAVGAQWNFQTWYRNSGGPCGSNFNTSSGWSAVFTN